MSEFRQISKAPLYEINKEGFIRGIEKQNTILPYPLKSDNVKLEVDGVRKPFLISEIVEEVWGKKIKLMSGQEVRENEGDEIHPATPPDFFEKTSENKTQTQSISSDSPEVKKILKLDCYESIKIWKLHLLGLDNEAITKLVNRPHDFVIVETIKKYKKNETLRKRADKY